MIMPFLQLTPLVAERVVNSIPGGLLIAALAWVVLRVVGSRKSETRFAVWLFALLAVAGLPFMESGGKAVSLTQAVRSQVVLPGVWAAGIFVAWMLIAALAIMRIVVGLWKLRRLRGSAIPLAVSSLPPTIQDVVAQFQSGRPVAVCSSSAVTVPTAIGFFKPVILIPDWVLRELSAEELKAVLLHEFAHLRRFDDWTNLAQKLMRTVFFFHPAVWWIEKWLSLEREMACDEAVLAETENPRAYAECLVSLAEKSFVRRGLALAQAAVGRARETSLRLARILDGDRPRSSRVLRPSLGLAGVIAAGFFIALPDLPRLITFEDRTPAAPIINMNMTASSPLPVPSATVIPAALQTGGVRVSAAAMRKSLPAAKIYRTAAVTKDWRAAPRPIEARPVIIRANVPDEIGPPQFQFVMEITQYDERGSTILSLSVWRVTFDSEDQKTIRQEVIVRSL